MLGCNISSNICKTFEIVQYCSKSDMPALIVTIDFEKCFDQTEQKAILAALRYFDFGEKFIKWISFISEWFPSKRGCRQGCNLAPLLFLICGQLLFHQIQKYDIIALISQFADDTNFFLSFDQITLNEVIETLKVMETNIGLKVNYDKTKS